MTQLNGLDPEKQMQARALAILEREKIKNEKDLEADKVKFVKQIKMTGKTDLSVKALLKKQNKLRLFINRLKFFFKKLIWSI